MFSSLSAHTKNYNSSYSPK